MKLAYSLFILLVFAGCTLQNTQPNNTNQFVKFFGKAKNETAHSMIQTQDGGFLIVGSSRSFGAEEKAYVAKADANGNRVWFNTYGIESAKDSNITIARSALELANGNFLILGEGVKKGATTAKDTTNFLLIETRPDGTLERTQQFATKTKNDQGFYITKLVNGGFLLTGITNTNNTDLGKNIKFIKINEARDAVLFERSEGISNSPDEITNVLEVETTKGFDFLLSGTITRGASDLSVIRTTENGLYRFAIPFGNQDSFNQTASEMKLVGKKDFIIVGSTDENGTSDVYLVKVDVEVDATREKKPIMPTTDDGDEVGVSIEPTNDGGFIIGGTKTINAQQGSKAFLMKVDANLNFEWMEEYGDLGKDNAGQNAASFVKAIDGGAGGYALLGTFYFANNTVMGLIRTDSRGKTLTK